MAGIWKELTETYRFRWVVYSFISSNLRMRYKRSVLGFFWSLLGPMFNYLIMGFVISKVARFATENYMSHMLLGSLAFSFMSTCFALGGNSLISNEHYIRKIYLPKLVFPLSAIGMEFVNFLLGFFALVIVLALLGGLHIGWGVLILPISFLLILMFSLGVGSVFSVFFVFFRDMSHVIPILMQAAYFLTPILYPKESIPERYHDLLLLNPFYYYVELMRRPLVEGSFSLFGLAICTVLSISTLLLGLMILKRFDNKVVFKL